MDQEIYSAIVVKDKMDLTASVDETLLAKLADSIETATNLVISVFDFGGQSVFNAVHHFFLVGRGVYVIAFNMEWSAAQSADTERFLAYLKFDSGTGQTAPIALVGTHKDKVGSVAEHERISNVLYNTFIDSLCWPSVIKNSNGSGVKGCTTLMFFPIDNCESRGDPSMRELLRAVEAAVDAMPYTHMDVPLQWLKALDELQALGSSSISYTGVCQVLKRCGMAYEAVRHFLVFFHEMGLLMWHDEATLRDVVILDPVAYLVAPATVVICKLQPSSSDATNHCMKVHKDCQRAFRDEW